MLWTVSLGSVNKPVCTLEEDLLWQNGILKKPKTSLFTLFYLCFSFYADFGPLNLAMLYRYCCKLNKKLKVEHSTTHH